MLAIGIRSEFLCKLNMKMWDSASTISTSPLLTAYFNLYIYLISSSRISPINLFNFLIGNIPLPFGSNLAQNSWNFDIVSAPVFRPSSSYDVSKLSRIIAIKRFRKMKDTR